MKSSIPKAFSRPWIIAAKGWLSNLCNSAMTIRWVFLIASGKQGQTTTCVGFKWTRGQNEDVLKSVVEDTGVKKIVLRRRNRIKTYVSEKIAQETQQWEVYSRHELTMPRPRIHVDAEELLQHIAINQHFYAELSADL